MNALDIVILVPLAWGLFIGYRKGFVKQISGLIFLLAGIWLAVKYAGDLSPWFKFAGEVGGVVAFVSILICAVILGFLISLFLTKLLEKLTLGPLNKMAGALLGLIKYGVLLSLVFKLMVSTGKKINALDVSSRHSSVFYPYISEMTSIVVPEMEKTLNSLIEKTPAMKLRNE